MCKLFDMFLNFIEQRLKRRHPNAIFPAELFHDELGIEMADQAIRVKPLCEMQSLDERFVFGDVVRVDADCFFVGCEDFSGIWVDERTANRRFAGIAARTTIGKEVERSSDCLGLVLLREIKFLILDCSLYGFDDKSVPILLLREELFEAAFQRKWQAKHGVIIQETEESEESEETDEELVPRNPLAGVCFSLMSLHSLLSTYLFLIPVVVLVLCEVVKLTVESVKRGSFAYDHFFHAGGFPSSHSAFVTSLLIIVGRKMGVESVEFAISVVFASVVWYDAFHARRELGLQAEMLNRLQSFQHFTTQLGHTFVEVLGGIVFGAVVTWVGIWLT